jgi:hypothetical protein
MRREIAAMAFVVISISMLVIFLVVWALDWVYLLHELSRPMLLFWISLSGAFSTFAIYNFFKEIW